MLGLFGDPILNFTLSKLNVQIQPNMTEEKAF